MKFSSCRVTASGCSLVGKVTAAGDHDILRKRGGVPVRAGERAFEDVWVVGAAQREHRTVSRRFISFMNLAPSGRNCDRYAQRYSRLEWATYGICIAALFR